MWGRRSVGIGLLLVALAVIGGIILLIAGGGGSSNSSNTSPQIQALQDRLLKHTVVDVQRGISVRRPKDWKDSKRNHVITLTSQDSCLSMTLAAPQDASKANGLHDDSIQLMKKSFGNAKVQPTPSGKQIGGIPTRSNTLTVNEKGSQLRVLLSVGKGTKYAYLTEVVVRSTACQADLQLGNLVLSSIQYTK
jgi:hypothetical protein